ncbi:hypothetical protein [Nocardiopsis alba]|uniref:hypothetical protein n=1 Tax=Nocardiopsis alba TaxID=53437 RepID=UPI00362BAD48
MSRTWGSPPETTAVDHPARVAEEDLRNGTRRCPSGCVAIEDARGENSSTDSHSFTCHGCGGAVCIGCRSTPVTVGGMFCTPCCNTHEGHYASMGAEEPITAGQMRALLTGVGDDVPLRALLGPHLKHGMQEWEIVAARLMLKGKAPEGPRAHFALQLRGGSRR